MADNAKPNEPGLTDQSAHSGLDWHTCRKELSFWDDVGNLIAHKTVVSVKVRTHRFNTDISNKLVASGMRAAYDARVSGK